MFDTFKELFSFSVTSDSGNERRIISGSGRKRNTGRAFITALLSLMIILVSLFIVYMVADNFSLFRPQKPDSKIYTVVNCKEYITLRQSPSTGAAAITTIPLGDWVEFIADSSNGFCRVEYNGMTGYVLSSYLSSE